MIRHHELKTWPSFWEAVNDGRKTFEARFNDRDFAVGDTADLIWWDPHERTYYDASNTRSLRKIKVRITYLLRGGEFGVQPGHCVFGFEKVTP